MRSLQSKKVLVVEDRYLIARDVCRAVRALGGEAIGPASDVESAQRLIDVTKIDLAVVDFNLRDGTVMPLIEQLTTRGVPFIVATGYEHWSLPPVLRNSPRVEKPISVHELQKAIERLQQ